MYNQTPRAYTLRQACAHTLILTHPHMYSQFAHAHKPLHMCVNRHTHALAVCVHEPCILARSVRVHACRLTLAAAFSSVSSQGLRVPAGCSFSSSCCFQGSTRHPGGVVHVCELSVQEMEAGGWLTGGQPPLRSESLSRNKRRNTSRLTLDP